MKDWYSHVKIHKRSLHKNCMRCKRPAVVTSKTKIGRTTMDGWYCEAHAIEGGIIKRKKTEETP